MKFIYFFSKKIFLYLFFLLILLPLVYVLLRYFLDQNNDNFFVIFFEGIKSIFTQNYNEFKNEELKNISIGTTSLFWNYFKESLWLIFLVFIIATISGFLLGLYLSIIKKTKRFKFIIILINFINFFPLFLVIPIFIILFSLLSANTYYVTIEESGFLVSLSSFIPMFLLFLLTSLSFVTSLTLKIANNHINKNFYIYDLTLGKNKKQLYFKTLFKSVLKDFLVYLIPIYGTVLVYSLLIERFFGFNGQSYILNFAFSNKETSLIFFSLLINFTIVFLLQIVIDFIYLIFFWQKK